MSPPSRRAFLASVPLAASVGGCFGLFEDGPELTTEGAITTAWHVDHAEPVETVQSGQDRVYVGSAAPGPTDVARFPPRRPPAYKGAVSAVTPAGEKQWQTEFSTRYWGDLTPVADELYLVTGRGTQMGPRAFQVRKLSQSGTEQWTTPKRQAETSIFGFAGDSAIVGTNDVHGSEYHGRLFAVRPDGEVDWTMNESGAARGDVYEDTVVAETGPAAVTAYDVTTGGRRWRQTAVAAWHAAGDTVHLISEGNVTAVDVTTGEARWTRESDVDDNPLVTVTEAAVVFTGPDGTLVGRDPHRGTQVWTRDLNAIDVDQLEAHDGTVVVADGDTVTSIDASQGTNQWQHDSTDAWVRVDGDRVFVYEESRSDDAASSVTTYDLTDGSRQWRVDGDVEMPVASNHGFYAPDGETGLWRLVPE